MEDLSIDDLNQLVNFYRQKASDLEFTNLQLQLKINKLTIMQDLASTTKVTKTKSQG